MKKTLPVLLALTFTAFGCAKKQPDALTKEYLAENRTAALAAGCRALVSSDFFPSDDVTGAPQMNDGGKIAVSLELGKAIGRPGHTALAAAFDPGKKQLRLDVDAPVDEDGTPFDASLYIGGNCLALASDALFGDNVYGYEFEDFASFLEHFDASALAAQLGFEDGTLREYLGMYGVDEAYIDSFQKAAQTCSDRLLAPPDRTLDDVLDGYYGEITEQKITVDGNEYRTLALPITANNELISDLYGLAAESFDRKLDAVEDFLQAIVTDEMRENGVNLDELLQGIRDTRDLYDIDPDELFGDADIDTVAVCYLDKVTGKLVKATLNGAVSGDGSTLDADITWEAADTAVLRGTLTDRESGETATVNGTASVTEENGAAGFVIHTDMIFGENISALDIACRHEENGDLRLYAAATDHGEVNSFILRGSLLGDANAFTLKIDEMSSGNGFEEHPLPLGLTVSYEKAAKVEALEQYKNILELTEDEYYALVGRAAAFFGKVG